jgi:micrococcal nuclease
MDLYTYKAHCSYVVDGDTADFTIDCGFMVSVFHRARFFGINTPERGQVGYQEAKDYVKSKILDKDILIETYKSDAFGRFLADIFYTGDDGELHHLNQELLDLGLAIPFKG